MAVAAQATVATRAETIARVAALRDRLADGLRGAVADTYESGVSDIGDGRDRRHKVAGNCHVCFAGTESEALLFLLEKEGIFASAASSCASGAQDPSHVLAAMGVDRTLAQGSLRLTLGFSSTAADVALALDAIPPAVARLRQFA
jgi:cysteine desulfurase